MFWVALGGASLVGQAGAAPAAALEAGVAVRDITPEVPIWLAGYAGRTKPAERIDQPLVVQALALRNPTGERFVLVALDNCEAGRAFLEPVLQQLAERCQLGRGQVAVVSSHTHSAPVLADTLEGMAPTAPHERERILQYSQWLRARCVEVVTAALADLQPAVLEYGLGQAGFAMNRRIYHGDQVRFGDNPDGPVDRDVPVLRVTATNGAVRAILFGYACHGTSVRSGEDWYAVSGEYMAYARTHLQAHQPGAAALYLTGMGADADPAPRGQLLHAKRHGLELAGAVIGVLDRPLRPVRGPFKLAYEEIDLPLVPPPSREQLERDRQSPDVHVQRRAANYLRRLDGGQPLPQSVTLPLAVLRLGEDLTLLLMGGEVVVDYARRLKRLLAEDHPWTVGYAYDVPCYIPSARLLKEGGYESEYSMIYYGWYGPLRPSIEDQIVQRVVQMVAGLRGR